MKKLHILLTLLIMTVSQAAMANRLIDAQYTSRCYATDLTQAQSAEARDIAYNVHGCITQTEYNYAAANSLAPMCAAPFASTTLFAVCTCDCFEEGTQINVLKKNANQDDVVSIEKIVSKVKEYDVYSVTNDSTLSTLAFENRRINVVTDGPEDKPLVMITTESGIEIGLSELHGVLLANGKMVIASEL